MGVYVLELAIKTVAWGLYGGRYAYLNYDIFNRIDFFVTVTCCIEIIVLSFDATFSFRAFRMYTPQQVPIATIAIPRNDIRYAARQVPTLAAAATARTLRGDRNHHHHARDERFCSLDCDIPRLFHVCIVRYRWHGRIR